MYERFTDRACKVLSLANQEALHFNHSHIGTEHILLGLIKEGSGVAACVLARLKIDLRTVRNAVEQAIGPSEPEQVIIGRLPHTPSTTCVLEQAIVFSAAFQDNYVGTEHILLGLLAVPEGVAGTILTQAGVTRELVIQERGKEFSTSRASNFISYPEGVTIRSLKPIPKQSDYLPPTSHAQLLAMRASMLSTLAMLDKLIAESAPAPATDTPHTVSTPSST